MSTETTIRLAFFLGVFGIVALGEVLSPRRVLTTSKAARWFANLMITGLNPLSVRLLFPMLPVGMAVLAQERGWGLLNSVAFPYWLEVAAGVLVLDLAIYLQHVLFHAIPTLWRLHMMHHADLDIDVTTGLRFHPIEIVLSMGIKIMVVTLLGPPALAVLVFEVLLNATSMFSHSNMRLPLTVTGYCACWS